jgi:peptidoglycan/xylan/chitin deacetylase (PgdA/CDA1 family)
MYEYGSRAGFWRLLDVFGEHDVACTFFACAVALERNPGAAAVIRPRGHDVVGHGYRWEDVTLLTRDQEREHIRLAVESISRRQRQHQGAAGRRRRFRLRLRFLRRRPALLDRGRR